jgi:hypothetical protein
LKIKKQHVGIFFLGPCDWAHQQALKIRALSFYCSHNLFFLKADLIVQLLPKFLIS